MKKNKVIWYIVGGLVVLLIIIAVAKKKGWIGQTDPTEVSTQKVKHADVVESVSANGKIQPVLEVKISADVSGEIIQLPVKEGDVVKQGELLVKINPDIYLSTVDRMIAAVNSAKANLENSKSRKLQAESSFTKTELTHKRNKKLYDQGTISVSDFEASQAAYDVAKLEVEAARQSVVGAEYSISSAEASVKEAKDNLKKTTIFAPNDGTVSKLNVEKGERILGTSQMAGTEIMRIADMNLMEVNVDVNENEIVKVRLGDTALIEVDAYLNRKFKGVVYEMANTANTTGSTTDMVTNFQVKIRIVADSYADLIPKDKPNQSPFRPGMSATVDIQTKTATNVLVIPIQAVTTRDTSKKNKFSMKQGESETAADVDKVKNQKAEDKAQKEKNIEVVFMNNKGVAKIQPVVVGIQDNNNIEIVSGLNEGDEVISAPYSAISKTLKDKDKIKIVKKEELFGADKKK